MTFSGQSDFVRPPRWYRYSIRPQNFVVASHFRKQPAAAALRSLIWLSEMRNGKYFNRSDSREKLKRKSEVWSHSHRSSTSVLAAVWVLQYKFHVICLNFFSCPLTTHRRSIDTLKLTLIVREWACLSSSNHVLSWDFKVSSFLMFHSISVLLLLTLSENVIISLSVEFPVTVLPRHRELPSHFCALFANGSANWIGLRAAHTHKKWRN